ncbi:hypothetical protein [Serinicoccus chungangensis]|uniref:hypothetical protein n=1 Tax=Serinicoccus chungangensis TaxID=767452 RepID=UPI0011180AD4|nr:hypothetical protein [Serinicoccus chungangensis]
MSPRSPEDGPADPEVDRVFREIVAGLRGEHDAQHGGTVNPPWPPAADQAPTPARPSHRGPTTPEGMATDHRSYEPPEEEEHFVPPPPEPLPAGDLHFWGIVVGLVVGPLLVVLSAVVPVLPPAFAGVGALLAIGGFVLLVLRQPRRRPPFDGDDGARV